ncbi:Nn.00g010560.m01.CDS01 [Neocucurbitaria sp. VM-36]
MSSVTAPSAAVPFPFLRLPLELREAIYSLYFKPADRLVQNTSLEAQGYFGGVYKFDLDLWRVNKQIHQESRRVWKRENVFVKIATPWPSAGMYRVYLMATDGRDLLEFGSDGRLNHISSEGLVPIVCTERRADAFTAHHALVQITAPFHHASPEHTVVVLLDDLHLFTQTWYYSALSYPMLNDRLSTTFVLRDPDYDESIGAAGGEKKAASIALQKRLLLPFEQVKGLYHMEISGYAQQVKNELERRMAIPIPTLQQCCENSAELMAQGDAALATNNASEALELYTKAFLAIHILIHGRTRRVLADVFFHEGIEHGRYAGQTGMTIRVVLRLKLVSRTVAAYLRLGQWGEAAYWGMRSIRIMREAMDTEFEDFLSDLLGESDVGMIYVRTATAFEKMENSRGLWGNELKMYADESIANSERLWALAVRYLKNKNKEGVRKELQSFNVPESVVRMFGDVRKSADENSTMGQSGSGEE